MSVATNVVRRGSIYYFRARVPRALRARTGRAEIWRSLRTADFGEARRRAAIVAARAHALWRSVGATMDRGLIKALVDDWLRAEIREDAYLRSAPEGERHVAVIVRRTEPWKGDEVVRTLDHDQLEELQALSEADRAEAIGGDVLRTEVSDRELRLEAQEKVFGASEVRLATEDESVAEAHVREVFQRHGIPTNPFAEDFEHATRLMMRAHADLLRVAKLRDAAGWREHLDDDPAEAILTKLSPPPPPAATGVALSSAEDAFLREARKNRTRGRIDEFEAAFRLFRDWLGRDPKIDEVSRKVAGEFRAALKQLPAHHATRPGYRDLPIAARIAKATTDGETRLLSDTSINGNYLVPLRQLFDWAKETGQVETNPFADIRVSGTRHGAKGTQRSVFSVAQLATLFGQPLFRGAAGERGKPLYEPGDVRVDDWRFWLLPLAAFSGARLNELAGLRLADFERIGDVEIMHIRVTSDEQSLKTRASTRVIPIHPALVELGLLRRVERLREEGHERLFPCLRPGARGYLSDLPSKFYADLIDRALGRDASLTFHGLRHTFITAMRAAGVPEDVRMALVGHERGNVHASYGEQPLSVLRDAVSAVSYPGLDLKDLARGAMS